MKHRSLEVGRCNWYQWCRRSKKSWNLEWSEHGVMRCGFVKIHCRLEDVLQLLMLADVYLHTSSSSYIRPEINTTHSSIQSEGCHESKMLTDLSPA